MFIVVDTVYLLLSLLAAPAGAEPPISVVGEFTNMRYTEEHAYGYAVQLWRARNGSLIGLFMASAGLAGDTPTGRIENVHFDPVTGRIRFAARLSLGTDPRDQPTRDLFEFSGTLVREGLIGEIAQSVAEGASPPLETRVMLRPAKHETQNFTSAEEWEAWVKRILQIRGPKWEPLDTYLRREFVMNEPQYPEQWHLPRPISPRQALRFAVEALERRGVRGIRMCEITWIQAPLGAAIIQATGGWKRGGSSFDAFALAIRDGTEAKRGHPAGEEAYLVARGIGADGKETYHTSGEDDLLFEFVSREELRALPKKCGTNLTSPLLRAAPGR